MPYGKGSKQNDKQWSEDIEDLCGSLDALFVAPMLHIRKSMGSKENVYQTKT